MAKYRRRPKSERNAIAPYPRVNFAGLKSAEYTPANEDDRSCFSTVPCVKVRKDKVVSLRFEKKIREIRGEEY